MPSRRPFSFHPFLFSAYPVIALLANNIAEVRVSEGLRPLILSLAGAAILFLVFKYWLGDRHRAALATSLALLVFFSYGHVYNAIENLRLLGFQPGRHRLLLPLWIALLLAGLAWIARSHRDFRSATRALNFITAVALAFPLAQVGMFGLQRLQASANSQEQGEFSNLRLPAGEPAPDIYYIILDGYTRDDHLQKEYRLDNEPFLQALEGLGFYVARCSQSNYAQTQLSLASSLNAGYLENLGGRDTSGNTGRAGLPELIQHSRIRRALEHLGYRTVSFETGFEATQWEDADVFLSSGASQGIEDFESLLVRTTAGRVVAEGIAFLNLKPDWEKRDQAHRQRILYTLDELPQVVDLPGPKFVFVHIIAPHWPHVFGPNGEPVHVHPDSVSGYRDQVIFISKRIEPILAQILNQSATPPVIVVQGDHGAVIESPERRMAILNAYYLPGAGSERLYESISPVNTFRLILDQYFGDNLPLLQDQAFYSRYDQPFDFQEVANDRAGCE